jgi:hypothetical protein
VIKITPVFSLVCFHSEADNTNDIIIISVRLFISRKFELLFYLLEFHDNWYMLVLN